MDRAIGRTSGSFQDILYQYEALKPDVEACLAAKQWAEVALTVDEVNEKIDKLRKQIAGEVLAADLRADLDCQVAERQRAAADDQFAAQANEILEIKILVKNIEQRMKLASISKTILDTRESHRACYRPVKGCRVVLPF